MKPKLFEEYFRDTCQIKKQDMIAFLKANTSYSLKETIRETTAQIHVYIGEKENREIKRSAETICRMVPSCSLHRLKDLRHGEFSINCSEQYAEAIRQITCRR